jgi:hypothetical protein
MAGTSSFRTRVLILGAAIFVLAVSWVLGLVFSPASVGRRASATPVLASSFQRELVGRITIHSAGGELQLRRRGESWYVLIGGREFPADAGRVDALLGFLTGLKRARTITASPDAWQDFQVQQAAPRRLLLSDAAGTTLAELIVGKEAEGGGGEYLRLSGENEVVLGDRSVEYYLSTEDSFWSYLRLLPEAVKGQSIMRISVKGQLSPAAQGSAALDYTLLLDRQKGNVWTAPGQGALALDSAAVDRLASGLADMAGSAFAPGVSASQAGLSSPAAQLLISTLDGKDYRFLVGSTAAEGQHYVGLAGGDYVYRVADWRLSAVLRPLAELAASPAESSSGSQR